MQPDRPNQQQRRPEVVAARAHQAPARLQIGSNRLRSLAVLVTGGVLAIGALCAGNGARRIGETFPGFLVLHNRIVVSIGRPQWSLEKTARILFAEVVGIENHPLAEAAELQVHAAKLPNDTAVSYRFRKQAEVFAEVVAARVFTVADYLSVYGSYFAAGVCFALAGLWVVLRVDALAPAVIAFFVFCQACALVLLTGGDLYGPYWFTPLYFTAFSFSPAALLHLAGSFPEPIGIQSRWRRVALGLLYAGALALALVFHLMRHDPSLFLPLLYTVYLLLANALFLYLARLLLSRSTIGDGRQRSAINRALLAVLLSGLVAGVIFVTYPALRGPVSPLLLVWPLVIFPVFTAGALVQVRSGQAQGQSLRLRLSLLFLGAVETAFLIGVALFWLNTSRDRLLDDFTLNHQQQARVERFLEGTPGAALHHLGAVAALLETVDEQSQVEAASAAVRQANWPAARGAIEQLRQRYHRREAQLHARRKWIDRGAAALVIGLIVTGLAQSLTFMVAVGRWLIQPINQLTVATGVLATGDLRHRIELGSADEFARLAESVNAMAHSLGEIQQQVDVAQEQHRRAAGAARASERHRLARALHDTVLQDLIAVKLGLEIAGKQGSSLQPMVEQLMRLIGDLRRVVDELRPPDLGEASLAEAVTAHAQVLARGHNVALRVDIPPHISVPDWATRDVYRIAQESLANAVRHGAPKLIAIRLYRNGGETVLEVSDDGAGFELSKAMMGSGILGMRERAAALGAELKIITAPGQGTTVRLVLPPVRSEPWRYAEE